MLKTDSIGLVLSGGGGKGAYQIGVFQALCETGWSQAIQGFSGASIGALNAAALTTTSLDRVVSLWKNISPLQFLDIDLPLASDGLFSREGLVQLIRGQMDLAALNTEKRPVYANTTQVLSDGARMPRYYRLNSLSPAQIETVLLASSAFPLAYPSVFYEGGSHLDGGICDNVPLTPLYREGLRKMIVVNIGSDKNAFHPEYYPDVEFLEISPSRDIGALVDGTLDFSPEGASFRIDLGYRDALRILRAYEAGELNDPDYARKNEIEAQSDYQQAVVNAVYDQHKSKSDQYLKELDDLYKKYM